MMGDCLALCCCCTCSPSPEVTCRPVANSHTSSTSTAHAACTGTGMTCHTIKCMPLDFHQLRLDQLNHITTTQHHKPSK
jgi:hypothetical protein